MPRSFQFGFKDLAIYTYLRIFRGREFGFCLAIARKEFYVYSTPFLRGKGRTGEVVKRVLPTPRQMLFT